VTAAVINAARRSCVGRNKPALTDAAKTPDIPNGRAFPARRAQMPETLRLFRPTSDINLPGDGGGNQRGAAFFA